MAIVNDTEHKNEENTEFFIGKDFDHDVKREVAETLIGFSEQARLTNQEENRKFVDKGIQVNTLFLSTPEVYLLPAKYHLENMLAMDSLGTLQAHIQQFFPLQ